MIGSGEAGLTAANGCFVRAMACLQIVKPCHWWFSAAWCCFLRIADVDHKLRLGLDTILVVGHEPLRDSSAVLLWDRGILGFTSAWSGQAVE